MVVERRQRAIGQVDPVTVASRLSDEDLLVAVAPHENLCWMASFDTSIGAFVTLLFTSGVHLAG